MFFVWHCCEIGFHRNMPGLHELKNRHKAGREC